MMARLINVHHAAADSRIRGIVSSIAFLVGDAESFYARRLYDVSSGSGVFRRSGPKVVNFDKFPVAVRREDAGRVSFIH